MMELDTLSSKLIHFEFNNEKIEEALKENQEIKNELAKMKKKLKETEAAGYSTPVNEGFCPVKSTDITEQLNRRVKELCSTGKDYEHEIDNLKAQKEQLNNELQQSHSLLNDLFKKVAELEEQLKITQESVNQIKISTIKPVREEPSKKIIITEIKPLSTVFP